MVFVYLFVPVVVAFTWGHFSKACLHLFQSPVSAQSTAIVLRKPQNIQCYMWAWEGDFDKGQICVQMASEGGGPQHCACCIAGKHKYAFVCPDRPVPGSTLWHRVHLPLPARAVGLWPVHQRKYHWCFSIFTRKQIVFKSKLRL